jgi:beta-lactamase class A
MSHFTDRAEALTHSYTPQATWDIAVLNGAGLTERFQTGEEEPIEAASINKLAIAYAFQRRGGMHLLGEEVQIEETDVRRGAGVLHLLPVGFRLPLGAVQYLSLSESDNTATRILVRILGGPIAINKVLASDAKLPNTRLKAEKNNLEPTAGYEYGVTTAPEAALLMWRALHTPAQAEALRHGNFNQGLRYFLEPDHTVWDPRRRHVAKVLRRAHIPAPPSFYQWVLQARPPETKHPNKEGRLPGLRHDVARIGEVIVAALSTNHPEEVEDAETHPAWEVQRRLGKAIFEPWPL